MLTDQTDLIQDRSNKWYVWEATTGWVLFFVWYGGLNYCGSTLDHVKLLQKAEEDYSTSALTE